MNNYLLENFRNIDINEKDVRSISIFPSGNFISISGSNSIKIWDFNFNLLQHIKSKFDNWLCCSDIKDENNFVISSDNKNITTWIKKYDKFELNKLIKTNHKKCILKVKYFKNGNIISTSIDNTIKIFEQNEKFEYQNIITLCHSKIVKSILLYENKNIFISSGEDGTKFWNLNNYEFIFYLKNVFCCFWNSLCKIDDDNFIVGEKNSFKIISISKKLIIKDIKTGFSCNGICYIKDKNILIVAGSLNIILFKYNNFEYFQKIQNQSDININGLIELKNGLIISYSHNKILRVWIFKNYN